MKRCAPSPALFPPSLPQVGVAVSLTELLPWTSEPGQRRVTMAGPGGGPPLAFAAQPLGRWKDVLRVSAVALADAPPGEGAPRRFGEYTENTENT